MQWLERDDVLQPELYAVSRSTLDAGVIFSTSFAALLFTFVLLLILSCAGRIRRGRDEVHLVTSSSVTRTLAGEVRGAEDTSAGCTLPPVEKEVPDGQVVALIRPEAVTMASHAPDSGSGPPAGEEA